MEHLIIPKDYHSELNLHDTQIAIKTVKDFFQNLLALRLNLSRVSAPLFVDPLSGLNDNLNGIERPVTFDIKEQNGKEAEVVQSLAKWKRYALKKYGFDYGEGLYTDMNAIRRDEDTDNIHSIFVDQWDWEKIIHKEDRNIETLKETVNTVYNCLRKTEKYMAIQYDYIEEILPHDIFFITTQELEEMFPDNTPKEREYYITKTKGAVCIMKIGDTLENGEPHDGRAPDYDDWSLNADIVVYYPVLDIALEISSMGIRVDKKALLSQLKKAGCEIIHIPSMEGMLDMKLLMKKLAALEIDSVIIEGGGGINWSALKSGIVNKVQIYVAPKIFGGAGAPSPVMGEGIDSPNEAYEFSAPKLTVLGNDILMESEVKNVHRNS